jgi:hypothetical protein
MQASNNTPLIAKKNSRKMVRNGSRNTKGVLSQAAREMCTHDTEQRSQNTDINSNKPLNRKKSKSGKTSTVSNQTISKCVRLALKETAFPEGYVEK